MNGAHRWTRRAFLAVAVAAAGTATYRLAGIPTASWGPRPDPRRCRELLLAAAPTRALSEEVGRLYLEREDTAGDADRLVAEILERLGEEDPGRLYLRRLSGEELDRRLDRAIRWDFTLEDGVRVIGGWYMSRTECRLAALKFLAATPG